MSLNSATQLSAETSSRPLLLRHSSLQYGALWVFAFSGSIAKIEPSPYEALFVVVALIFLLTGLKFDRRFVPFLSTLVLLNIGGLFSVAPYVDETRYLLFTLISIYMAATSLFFACIMLEQTYTRVAAIKSGYIWTAAFAGALSIVGYFDQGALKELLTRNERAAALFKDPNVLGPFLVLPLVWIADDLVTGAWTGARKRITLSSIWSTFTPFFFVLAGMFLSFSRGAWGVVIASVGLSIALRFFLDASAKLRARIVFVSLIGVGLLAAMLAAALTIPQIQELFEQRASLNQDYDGGALGRFGGQARSIPLLLDSPNGFGPLRFPLVVGNEDPHNVFVNSFAAYGWIGGLSYFALVLTTLYVGWRLVLRKGPYRSLAIPIWATCFFTILQGLQIDTDHWRHFWLLVGLSWGLAVASARHEAGASSLAKASAAASGKASARASSSAGRIPRSVTRPLTNRDGVTSKAGFAARAP
jgi:hypothetical protein